MSMKFRRAGHKTIDISARALEEFEEAERRRAGWEAHHAAEQLRRSHPDWRVKG